MPDLSLFRPLPEADLASWARSLKFFRICTSAGGFADDNGTWIEARASFMNEEALLRILDTLELSLVEMPVLKPRVPIGHSGNHEVFPIDPSSPTAIATIPKYQQIGHCHVESDPCFIWVDESSLKFTFGTDWTVTEDDVTRAQNFERHLTKMADRFLDPPIDSKYCLCPKHYPLIWNRGSID